MRVLNILALITMCCFSELSAQGFIFGPKFGPSIATQKWNGIDRQPLFSFHAAAYIESYDEDSPSSLYAQLGYHERGSSQRTRFNSGGGNIFDRRQSFEFKNIVFSLGAKRIIKMEAKAKPYYILALRAEYTLSTNLDQYERYNGYFPIEPFVNKFNYGFTVGGGFQYAFSELVGGVIEFSISPDVSKQYDQWPISDVINPFDRFGTGANTTLPEQQIRNLSVEISMGLRLLRKVEYID